MRSAVKALAPTLGLELVLARVNAVSSGLMTTPLVHTAYDAERDTIVKNRAAILPGKRASTVGEGAQVIFMLMTYDSITGEMGKDMTPVSLAPHMMSKTAFKTVPTGSMVR
jgi:NAD(P)-dependent dehydrogenase (short-subunit alcohol dehydrogenase family)